MFKKIMMFGILTGLSQAVELGSVYNDDGSTTFRVYATDADKVEVLVYKSEKSDKYQAYQMSPYTGKEKDPMEKAVAKNTWELRLTDDLEGKYYHYRVNGNTSKPYDTIQSNIIRSNGKNEVFLFNKDYGYMVDTTAKGYMDGNGATVTKSSSGGQTEFRLVKDGDSFDNYYTEVVSPGEYPSRINNYPVSDPYCKEMSPVKNKCRVVTFGEEFDFEPAGERIGFIPGHTVHEVHIKDLTRLMPGIPEKLKGTYLGIAHPKTLKMLHDMHVTTIEFLPVHEFDATAAPPGHINYWGYMTKGFFAVHGAYSSKQKQQRLEFKQAVEALHKAGISVVMDVVYNHTSEGDHRGPNVSHKNLARNEYFRMWNAKQGYFDNATGCGNTCASENPVMRKLILDSLKYWVEQFQIDGFRFDLGAAIDKETFRRIRKELPSDTYLSAEPWVAAGSPQWMRGDLNDIRLGKWNDQYRKSIKGGGGQAGFINGQGNEYDMKVLVRGEHNYFGGSGSFYHTNSGNTNPDSIINEIEVHDGYTLADWLDLYNISEEEKHKRIKLAHTLLLTAVNVPIVHLGQEFARTKKGEHNSYDQDNEINWIDWGLKARNKHLNDFVTGLKKLRSRYDAFHFNQRITDDRIHFLDDRECAGTAFGYKLRGSKYEFIVLINSAPFDGANFDLPEGVWDVISNGEKVHERGLGKVTNNHYYLNPGANTAILRKKL
jgi:pullulanase/glycogen debranching enzyme